MEGAARGDRQAAAGLAERAGELAAHLRRKLGARYVVSVNGRTVTDHVASTGAPAAYTPRFETQPQWAYRLGAAVGFGGIYGLLPQPRASKPLLAGLAMVGLTFTTDPTLRTTPKTWHGFLHDAFFVLLGLTIMPAMVLLGFVFREDPHWENLAWYTWMTATLAVPTFWLKGAAFYIFLLAELIWWEVISLRLKRKVIQANRA